MATIFDNLTALPASFAVGEIITWVETLTDYPGATHSIAYKFAGQTPLDGFQQFSIAGTETSTATYTFVTLTTYKPGIYTWEKQITLTSGSLMRVVECGQVVIQPNAATSMTTTTAATMVTTLETVLATFAASANQSVSFNGQSYSRGSISDYRNQLVFWKARVFAERRAWDALKCCGSGSGGRIATEFLPAG